MPVGLERRHEGLFERQAGIVTADCDSHGLAAAILSPPAIRHQVLGKLSLHVPRANGGGEGGQ